MECYICERGGIIKKMKHVVESYENYKEEERLTTNNARRIEFLTTTKVLEEIIPPKSRILDCAAGSSMTMKSVFGQIRIILQKMKWKKYIKNII